jgi:hypothetical protein
MTNPDKEYTAESIRLRANELMLNSKGFMLFSVGPNGELDMAGDTTELSAAERCGLRYFTIRETGK